MSAFLNIWARKCILCQMIWKRKIKKCEHLLLSIDLINFSHKFLDKTMIIIQLSLFLPFSFKIQIRYYYYQYCEQKVMLFIRLKYYTTSSNKLKKKMKRHIRVPNFRLRFFFLFPFLFRVHLIRIMVRSHKLYTLRGF